MSAEPLPPPRAPRVRADSRSAAAYASFVEELRAAHQGALAKTLEVPEVLAADRLPWCLEPDAAPDAMSDATMEQATARLAHKAEGTLAGMNLFADNLLREFMALRIVHGAESVRDLGELSDLASDIQSGLLEQQKKATTLALAEARKAADKTAWVMKLTKGLELVVAGSTAVMAVFTFGVGMPLFFIGSAALVGFAAGGVTGDPESGRSFDAMVGLRRASYVVDGMMLTIGLGAALLAMRAAAQTAAHGVAKGVSQQMVAGVRKAAEASATRAHGQACRMLVEDGSKQVTQKSFEALQRAGFKVIDASREKAAQASGQALTERMTKRLAEVASGTAIDRTAVMTWQELMASVNKQFCQQSLKEAGTLTARGRAGQFVKLFNSALLQNLEKLGVTATDKLGAVGKQLLGQDFGTQMARMSLLMAGIRLFPRGLVKGQQYRATLDSLNAQHAEAEVKSVGIAMEQWQNQYDTLQTTLQNLAESRSKAIDAMSAMLKSDQQVNMMIARNYAGR